MYNNFHVVKVDDCGYLETIINDHLQSGKDCRVLFVSEWDKVSQHLMKAISSNSGVDELFVVDTFDVPNALPLIRGCFGELSEDLPKLPQLRNYPKIPALLSIRKRYPKMLEYNGSIFNELGC